MELKTAVIGIPDRSEYGDLSQLRAGQLVDWIRQRHQAERAGLHEDIRFGNKDTGLFSWAARKGLPAPGQKYLAVQQPLHSHGYGQFEGKIEKGYGAGTVEKADEGKALITKIEPNKIHLTLAHKKYPERYVLFRTPKYGENKWLLMNTTPTVPPTTGKLHFKTVEGPKVEELLDKLAPQSSVQEKIDGAATLNELLKDKIELLSHRTSKVTQGPIFHSEKVFKKEPELEIPKKYQGSLLRSELYGVRDNKPIPVQELGGLLNSSLYKSLTDQKARNIKFKNMVFDVAQVGKKPVDINTTPYSERLNTARDIIGSIGGPDKSLINKLYHFPREAKTPEDALKMWRDVKTNKNPLTHEGVVIHPELGRATKAKAFHESDVYLRGFFPGMGKYQDRGVGGFVYSHEPTSDIVGEVGTGFDDPERIRMFTNPQDYIGQKVRVQHTGKLPSGALFQPSYLGPHLG